MKSKIFFSLLFLLSKLFAMGVGNVADPIFYRNNGFIFSYDSGCNSLCRYWFDDWSLRFGFWGDYLYDRSVVSELVDQDFDGYAQMQMFTNQGLILMNLGKCLDLFALLGESSLNIDTIVQAFDSSVVDTTRVVLEAQSSFSYGCGFNWRVLSFKIFHMGLQGRYLQSSVSFDKMRAMTEIQNVTILSTYREWQAAACVSAVVPSLCSSLFFSPYVCFRYNRFSLTQKSNEEVNFPGILFFKEFPDFTIRNKVGYAIGCSMVANAMISFTAEGRFGNETGLMVNGQLRF